jgi:hypothetical protein
MKLVFDDPTLFVDLRHGKMRVLVSSGRHSERTACVAAPSWHSLAEHEPSGV